MGTPPPRAYQSNGTNDQKHGTSVPYDNLPPVKNMSTHSKNESHTPPDDETGFNFYENSVFAKFLDTFFIHDYEVPTTEKLDLAESASLYVLKLLRDRQAQ